MHFSTYYHIAFVLFSFIIASTIMLMRLLYYEYFMYSWKYAWCFYNYDTEITATMHTMKIVCGIFFFLFIFTCINCLVARRWMYNQRAIGMLAGCLLKPLWRSLFFSWLMLFQASFRNCARYIESTNWLIRLLKWIVGISIVYRVWNVKVLIEWVFSYWFLSINIDVNWGYLHINC